MVVGFILGVFRMLVDTPVTLGLDNFPSCIQKLYAQGSPLWITNNINFQYFSVLITVVSAVVMVAVSCLTAAPAEEKIRSLTFGTATEEDSRRTRASWDWRDVLASAFVLACIIGAYVYFRG
jgi:SSS family solute:Na+ symporter